MSHGVLKETTIENVIEIAAPAEKVFDFVVDVRNEPQWNPQMLQAEMLTPEPIGAGTRFRVRFGRGVGEALIEDIRVSRPRSWAAISQSRALDVLSEGQIDETSDGSRLVMRMRLHPRGTLRLLTPVLGVFMHRTMDQDLRRVKARLEPDPSTAVQAAPKCLPSRGSCVRCSRAPPCSSGPCPPRRYHDSPDRIRRCAGRSASLPARDLRLPR